MTTPIIPGEGNAADAARLSQLNANPLVARLATQPHDATGEDKALAALLSDRAIEDARERSVLLSGRRGGAHLLGPSAGSVHIPTGMPNQFNVYTNRDMIADDVMPPVVVKKMADKIWALPTSTLLSTPNVAIAGSRARPGEVPYAPNSSLSYACNAYGLVDFNDNDAIANADTPLDLRVISAMVLKGFLDLARELRVAAKVFGSSYYGTSTETVSGADRWDQASSDPVAQLLAAKETMLSTPNVLVLGGQVWPKLRTNPNVLKYILGRAGVSNIGQVPAMMQLAFFAEMLEVERVVVGRAKYLTNQEGGTATQGYVWGKSAALIRVEANPNPKQTACFGYTYRFESIAYRNEVIPERLPGRSGGEYLKLTHADDEKVLGADEAANPTGYLFQTVIS